ncbi:unnamed protein product [Allacma fusca]|uniref:SMP-30/Gluconolactonase/LRE-like region domain-containing protein n=1 Tax=Allacma fusca TaxID=39272 RepID=A0A8J2JXN7_9HEXA|nr:unnamed protein product [Allacma fusca]
MGSFKIDTIPGRTQLGEGPHWVPESQSLYYVDIFDPALYRYVPSTGKVYKLALGTVKPSFVIPVEGESNKFVVGYHREIVVLEWDGESAEYTSLKTIASIEEKFPGTRFNDAKCDPQGRMWVGTFGQTEAGELVDGKGVLFSLELNGTLTQHLDKINLANGLAWSKDSTKFYFVDSTAHAVYVFDFDGVNGTLRNQRVHFDMKKNGFSGLADGLCTDEEDNLWLALFGGAKVLHIDGQTGAVLDSIDFQGKCSNLTSLAFGGPNLDVLYVTSATFGLKPEEIGAGTEVDAGALFAVSNLRTKASSPAVNYRGKLTL